MQLVFRGNIVKPEKFCPDPVAKYGIPDYANSKKNPAVKGTLAWQQWWEEQFYYCINGYDAGGMFITGNYYKFLNFDLVSTVGKGNHPPGFIDFQYEFFNLVEYAKLEHWGIIGLKARRKGMSEMVSSIMDSGFRFKDGYHAGICAGLQKYTDDFVQKLTRTMYLKPDEMMLHTLEFNDEKIVAGWEEMNANKQWVQHSNQNTIYMATMKTDPAVFKGKYLDDAVFEEGGEFEMLDASFNATEACFKDGDFLVGTPYVYGTGGNMNKGSRAFSEMWAEAKSLRLIKVFVPAGKMYFPCVSNYKDPHGNVKEDVPNLKKKYKDYERVGMEDEDRANELITNRKAELKKGKKQKTYWEYMQNYPQTERESFLKFSANNFDADVLNKARFEIESNPRKYQIYELSWKRDEKGVLLEPLQVDAQPLDETEIDPFDPRHLIMIHKMPRTEFRDLDVAGLDGYNQDQTKTSKSLGAMVIYRRNHDFNFERNLPIALIRFRPPQKEIFFETCLMASVMYNLVGNVLADANSDLVIEHFVSMGCSRYLAERPVEFDSPNSQQVHKWGVKFSGSSASKPRAIGFVQTEIIQHAHKWVFPMLIDDFLDYDVTQKESDWDSADAFMIAKIRDIDMSSYAKPTRDEPEKSDAWAMPNWVEGPNGYMIDISDRQNNNSEYKDPFLRMLKNGML